MKFVVSCWEDGEDDFLWFVIGYEELRGEYPGVSYMYRSSSMYQPSMHNFFVYTCINGYLDNSTHMVLC